MVRTRPTVILVMAILSIVFGSLGVLILLCSGAMLLVFYNVQFPQPGGGTDNPVRELFDRLQKEIPGYAAIEISHYALGLVLALLLIISGVGLLRMKIWARWTSVIYSILAVVTQIAYFIFGWMYVNPITESWRQEWIRKQPQGTPAFSGSPLVGAIMGIGLVLIGIAFAVVLVIVMFLPNVSAAFAGRSTRPVEEEEDYYDVRPDDDPHANR